jgi:hypothetical protein
MSIIDADMSLKQIAARMDISTHVMRLVKHRTILKHRTWVSFTAGCGTQEYVKLIEVQDDTKLLANTRVVTAYGSKETYAQEDDYEFVIYVGRDNGYSMLQKLFLPENCIGLEYVGHCSGPKDAVSQWLGLFFSPNPKYDNQKGVKFDLTDTFVRAYFSRYVALAIGNPNVMLDLLGLRSFPRSFSHFSSPHRY